MEKKRINKLHYKCTEICLFLLICSSYLSAQYKNDTATSKLLTSGQQKNKFIYPVKIWPDTKGNHIQAHGGGVIKVKNTFYWYGEQRGLGLDSMYRYVSCYSSKDLVNWKFNGNVLKMSAPDSLPSKWVLERPKVYFNKKTKKFIMFFHIDVDYKLAQLGVAISDSPTGKFRYQKRFQPLGHQSRDIGQFIDDDGSAYLTFEDRKVWGLRIVKLSDDFLSIEKDIALIDAKLEGGGLVFYKGLYYLIGSKLTGWAPNANKFATAKKLEGPWSDFKDIAPPALKTYGSQSTTMLKIEGTKDTTVIFMGDIWKPQEQYNSTYLWMPLEIGDGKLFLSEPKPWRVNPKTGEVIFK